MPYYIRAFIYIVANDCIEYKRGEIAIVDQTMALVVAIDTGRNTWESHTYNEREQILYTVIIN